MKKKIYKSGFIAIIGKPNVGKSTLLNFIMGEKVSIISHRKKTTKDNIIAISSKKNYQFVFIDTPGIFFSNKKKENFMNNISLKTLEKSDLILYIVNIFNKTTKEDLFLFNKFKNIKKIVFLILNKIDLIKKEKILKIIDFYKNKCFYKEIIPISAKSGNNIDILLKLIYENLKEGKMYYDEKIILDRKETIIVNDIIREKILYHTYQEIPYCINIKTDVIEKKENIFFISSSIFVKKNSQKGILIGRKGEKINKIKKQSISELQKIFKTKIKLDLKVKIQKKGILFN